MTKRMVLIGGKSTTGKTASLRNINDPKGVMYLNCETGKDLPFRFPNKDEKFLSLIVTDPYQVFQALDEAEEMEEIHTVVIDTLTYLMGMFETQYVLAAADTQKGWGNYAEFFKKLHQYYFAKSTKSIIVLAHTADIYNKKEMVMESMVKVKGSTMNEGVEAAYSTVIATKKVAISELEKYDNPNLNISDKEKRLGYKHVFQTQITEDSINERIRANMGMWDDEETYIDNDVQIVIDRLHEYYD